MPLLTIATTLINPKRPTATAAQYVSIVLIVQGQVVSYENKLAARERD